MRGKEYRLLETKIYRYIVSKILQTMGVVMTLKNIPLLLIPCKVVRNHILAFHLKNVNKYVKNMADSMFQCLKSHQCYPLVNTRRCKTARDGNDVKSKDTISNTCRRQKSSYSLSNMRLCKEKFGLSLRLCVFA